MDDDAKTMLRFKNGDKAAFDELYNRYSKRIYTYVLRFVGNVYVSEDITQEVFVRMYGAVENYKPSARFSTWIFTIATNLVINEHHKNKRMESLEDDVVREDAVLTEDKVMLEELEHNFFKIINKLPANQKTTILLRSYEGMDYSEIAQVLKVSKKAVKSLLSRARERLMYEYKKENM